MAENTEPTNETETEAAEVEAHHSVLDNQGLGKEGLQSGACVSLVSNVEN